MSIRHSVKTILTGLALLVGLSAGRVGGAATPAPGTITTTGLDLSGGFGSDGYKTWEIFSKEFQTVNAIGNATNNNAPLELKGMRMLLYTGGPSLAIETTIESETATVTRQSNQSSQVTGRDLLYILGNGYKVTGYDWSWDGKNHIILVGRSVTVTFTAAATAPTTPTASSSAKPSQPVTILSDKLEIDQEAASNRFLFTGNVTISEAGPTVASNASATAASANSAACITTCQNLEVVAERAATANPVASAPGKGAASAPVSLGVGHIESIVARDQVASRQGDVETRSDQAKLFPSEQKVVLSGSPQVHVISSDTLLEGGVITWDRGNQTAVVDPIAGTAGAASTVRLEMPQLSSFRPDFTPEPGLTLTGGPRMVVTGDALTANLGVNERHMVIDGNVHVVDPTMKVSTRHLEAEFDPPPVAPNDSTTAAAVGPLNHLAAQGAVTIEQINPKTNAVNQKTTTDKAEIFPANGVIDLKGNAQVEDLQSHATIIGAQMTLVRKTDQGAVSETDIVESAAVTGTEGHPAEVILQSLPALGEVIGPNVKTHIKSNTITMQSSRDLSNYVFKGGVAVSAQNLNVTSGELDVESRNNSAGAASDTQGQVGQVGEIMKMVAKNKVEIVSTRPAVKASAADPTPGEREYKAHAARAEIYPQAEVAADSTDPTAEAKEYRAVELFGDPAGVEGPVRPEVELPPLPDFGWGTDTASTTNTMPTIITSDEQQLLTSPKGNTYWFNGNVTIDGGAMQGWCDHMQAESSPPAKTDATDPNAPVGATTLNNIVAEGHVRLVQGPRITTAGKAVFDSIAGKITLSEKAVVKNTDNGSSIENGDIELDRGDQSAHIISTTPNPGAPAQRSTFTVKGMNIDNSRKPANKPPAGTTNP